MTTATQQETRQVSLLDKVLKVVGLVAICQAIVVMTVLLIVTAKVWSGINTIGDQLGQFGDELEELVGDVGTDPGDFDTPGGMTEEDWESWDRDPFGFCKEQPDAEICANWGENE